MSQLFKRILRENEFQKPIKNSGSQDFTPYYAKKKSILFSEDGSGNINKIFQGDKTGKFTVDILKQKIPIDRFNNFEAIPGETNTYAIDTKNIDPSILVGAQRQSQEDWYKYAEKKGLRVSVRPSQGQNQTSNQIADIVSDIAGGDHSFQAGFKT